MFRQTLGFTWLSSSEGANSFVAIVSGLLGAIVAYAIISDGTPVCSYGNTDLPVANSPAPGA